MKAFNLRAFPVVVIFFGIMSHGFAQRQYKKNHREWIRSLSEGNVEEVIRGNEAHLSENPKDVESYFVLAIAYAQEGNIDQAISNVDKSLALGLPFSRYLAGPRDLLRPLVKSEPFREKFQGTGSQLLHGPMVSDMTDSKADFWVRTFMEVPVSVDVIEFGTKDTLRSETVQTKESEDYTAVLTVDGLKANTEYQYNVVLGDEVLGDQSIDERWFFKTYPENRKPTQIAVGFGGGAGYTPFYDHMWNTLSVNRLNAFLFLGDNVYIDHPQFPSVQDYCYYRRQSTPEYRNFISRTPVYAIWDDHDFATNDSYGSPYKDKPQWKIPVWEKYKNNYNNPYYGGGEENPGVWTDFSIGDIDFFMLDGRYWRASPAEESPSMLGKVQLEWLFEQLKQSEATFKVIASPVPWSFNLKKGMQNIFGPTGTARPNPDVEGVRVPRASDGWEGYAEEREKIFSFIEEHKIEGVILLSADRHRSDAWKISRENGYNLYEFESSKLTNVHTHRRFSEAIFSYNQKCSFGHLVFNTLKKDPEITYQVVSIDNEVIYELTLRRSQLEF